MQRINWKEKLTITGFIAIVVAGMYLLQTGCLFLKLTGIPCLGCGMTRALLLLLQGDFAGSFRHHGMVWSLPILYLLFLLNGRIFSKRWMNILLYVVLGAGFMLQWIGKLFS